MAGAINDPGKHGAVGRRLRLAVTILGILSVVVGLGVFVALRQLEPRLHEWVTSTLSRSLDSEIELGRVHLSWFPLRLTAQNLTVRHHGRTDIPPLLVVSSFTANLRPGDLWSSTVDHVKVDGMEIHIPPRDEATGRRPLPRRKTDGTAPDDSGDPVVVRRLTATNTRLAIVPRTEGKNPKVWDIYELEMADLGSASASPFRASLTNPIPYGTIESKGRFGPWQSDEPGLTPIAGEYTFAADLGTINGLGGQVNAVGMMEGILEQISTRGETMTEAFRLTELDGHSLPLNTSYEALVDGTKGDVNLTLVQVSLGRTHLQARGVVEGTKGIRGKRIVLNVMSKDADLAELLRFVSKDGTPPAQGMVVIDAAFDLPQGKEKMLDRFELEGSISAARLKFTNAEVQEKIDSLSRRAQGRPNDRAIDEVASKVSGKFRLRKGELTYRGLTFDVQGASIRMDGIHALKSKTLNLNGEVLLDASASQTLTGFKRWLVKPLDPLFRKKGAGTRLVIKVEGTQNKPKVTLELGKTLRGH